jgi:transcriptional regulator with GAF, ATPase, and Fis domain
MAWLSAEHTIRGLKASHRVTKVLTTIGRAPGNDVVLDDPGVAPTHATLVRSGAALTLSVSDKSGAYVNGRRTSKATLSAGDEVLLGAWKLTLHDGEPVAPTSEDVASLSTMEELVRLSADMMRDPTPEKLFSTLLRGLVKLTRAEKGFIIVFHDGERHLAAQHNVGGAQLDLSRVSDSIVDKVVETLQPVIVSDALHDQRFGKAQSVVDLKLSSVLCVPLLHAAELLGVIYLGNDKVTDLFTEQDLTVLRIYASQASLVVYTALLLNRLRLDNRALRRRLDRATHGEIIGASPPMTAVFKVVKRAAPTDLTVLVLGETGTGKELVAREIHARSARSEGPFVAINCGAIPEALLESELFGHRRGAFTGADSDKVGKIEAASGGTLFLDEIGEMPMNLQVKLLRVLQERVIERVGEVMPRKVDLRVVAATNRDPEEMVRAGTFREDLFYRLNELTITLPPLRDRGEDIELLAQYFLRQYREKYDATAKGFSNAALAALKSAWWPGNVRELENRVKKAVIMSDRALLTAEDLGLGEGARKHVAPLTDAVEQFKVDYIRAALEMNNWNKAAAARDLGVDARTIFRYIERIETSS